MIRRRDIAGIFGAATAAYGQESEWAGRIQQTMEETNVPGLSIAVVRNGKVEWRRGFGVKDRQSGAPVQDGTMFEAASMSKPVFAYRVMKLCETGKMNLDTPLTRYTAGRFLKDDPRLDLITARHVLSHTSGFQNHRSGEAPLKIGFAPGERWQYSGEGFAYLQSVVSELTGHVNPNQCGKYGDDLEVCATDFAGSMKKTVLGPFGMDSSGYLWSDAFAKRMARPHDRQGVPFANKKSTAPDVARYGSMGGLLTTASDYAKFLLGVISPPPADAFRINAASHREWLRPQIKVSEGDGYSIWWALGWRIARLAKGDLVSHGGDNAGFHSIAEFSLKDRSGFVLLTNSDGGTELIKRLAPAISQSLHN